MRKKGLLNVVMAVLLVSSVFIFTACSPSGWGDVVNNNGRYEVFSSDASNLVEGVGNGYRQIYMRDRQTGEIMLVSVGIDGEPADSDNDCYGAQRASISANGRYVVFDSDATNLVDMEFQGERQVYVRDLQNGVTMLVSLGYNGQMGDNCAKEASISADGRYIVYGSNSSNILAGVAGSSLRQIFLYERATGTTTLMSANSAGTQGNKCSRAPVISADGRYVAFDSNATNLLADAMPSGASYIYLRNIQSGVITLVSVGYDGNPANADSYNPSISSDGRYVAFYSYASNLVEGVAYNSNYHIHLRDMQEEVTTLVSVGYDGNPGNGHSYYPSISADGRYVAFYSDAKNLVDRAYPDSSYQIYLRDMQAEVTTLVSEGYDGNPGNDSSYGPVFSADVGIVYFYSGATNLVDGVDTGGNYQVYAWDRVAGSTAIISVNSSGDAGDGDSYVKD
jgi:Tol biopolymer transport system component